MSDASNKKFQYGPEFETKIVSCMLFDKSFAQQMIEVLKPDYFTAKHLATVTQELFAWYEKNKGFPAPQSLGGQLVGTCSDAAEKINLDRFFKNMHMLDEHDAKFVKDKSLEFCRMNHLLQALEQCLNFTEAQDYDKVVSTIKTAVAAGSERNFGHIYKDELDERMLESSRKPVATPWRVLNEIIGGGISAGELGVILALTGVGKSHALVDLGSAAAQAGLHVVHFTFELSEVRVGKRYDARLSGIPHDDLPVHRDRVEKTIENLTGSVRIKKYPNRQATVQTLRNYVGRLQTEGTKPDVLIVDYADIMRSGKSYENKRFEEEAVYEELRALADELSIPIWTASQTNRTGMDVEVLTLKHIAECFAKANTADLFITMNRKKSNDYAALVSGNYETLGNMYIAKSRLGPDGVKFNCLVNTALSQITCLEPGSPEEEQAKVQHDLQLETDAQRIRNKMTSMRTQGQGPNEKASVVRLVPQQHKENN